MPVPVEEELRLVPLEESVAERENVLLRPGPDQLPQTGVGKQAEVVVQDFVAPPSNVQDHGPGNKGKEKNVIGAVIECFLPNAFIVRRDS